MIIEQAVGHCGDSGTVKTEMFRISHYDPSMSKKTIIGYEKTLKNGNIIQIKPNKFDKMVHKKLSVTGVEDEAAVLRNEEWNGFPEVESADAIVKGQIEKLETDEKDILIESFKADLAEMTADFEARLAQLG